MVDTFPQIFQINIPFLVILGLALLAGLLAWWQYRYRFAINGLASALLLAGLRALVWFAVLLLLFAPVLRIISPKKHTAHIAVYVDNSASMWQNRLDSTRWQRTEQIVRRLPQLSAEDVRLDWFVFNRNVRAVSPDSIAPAGTATSFTAVFNHIRKNKIRKALVLSDGINTDSELEMGVFSLDAGQVYSVGIGKGQGGGDIFIEDVIFRPVVYAGKPQTVEIRLRGRDLKEDQKKLVTLYAGQKRLGRKLARIGSDGALQSLEFTCTLTEPGMIRFKAEVEPLPGEANTVNNRRFFVQRVLKTRLQIALFSSRPAYEAKFLRLLLMQNQDFDLHYFVEKSPGSFFYNRRFDPAADYDCMIFSDFPGKRTSQTLLEQLRASLRQSSAGLLVFAGSQTDAGRLQAFEPRLPFERALQSVGENEVLVDAVDESAHALLNVFDDAESTRRFWNTLPPVFVSSQTGSLKPGALALLQTKNKPEARPIAWLYERKGARSAVFLGEGYWRWHFLLQRDSGLADGYARFLQRLVRWLSDRSGNKPVVVRTAKTVTHPGEAVELKIFLNDAAMLPVRDGEITIQVRSDGQTFELETEADTSGVFYSRFLPPSEGTYKVTVKGYRGGQFLGRAETQIEVVPFNREFLRLGQDSLFLKKIAGNNNGFYVSENGLDSLKYVLLNDNPVIREERRFELRYAPWLLAFILTALTAEWIIRKKTGLV